MDKAPSNPFGITPLRKYGSLRRTTTIETTWPDGYGEPMLMVGTGRDLLTKKDGEPVIIASDKTEQLLSPTREIIWVKSDPPREHVTDLKGCRAGGHLRSKILHALPTERSNAAPLYLLLDDLSGASLVAGWAYSRWHNDWREKIASSGMQSTAGKNGNMTNICTAFAEGSTALDTDGRGKQSIQSATIVPPLANPDDKFSWHELANQESLGFRRARRLDMWIENEIINVEIHFQDSATAPNIPPNHRVAIHEYEVNVKIDPEHYTIISVDAIPHALPYKECPGAIRNMKLVEGVHVSVLREWVPDNLKSTMGCTHLNDVLRSLAEVPILVQKVENEITHG